MANYSALIKVINNQIKANGNQEITGPVLNAVLRAIVSGMSEGALFAGIADTTTNPGTPDGNVLYIAIEPGNYTNFGVDVPRGSIGVLHNMEGNKWDVFPINTYYTIDVDTLMQDSPSSDDIDEAIGGLSNLKRAIIAGVPFFGRSALGDNTVAIVQVKQLGDNEVRVVMLNTGTIDGSNELVPIIRKITNSAGQLSLGIEAPTSFIGPLSSLNTNEKGSVVGAINEVNTGLKSAVKPYVVNLTSLLAAQDSESISTAIGGIDNLNGTVQKNQVIFGTLANGTVAVGIRVLGNQTTLTYFVDSVVGLTVNEVIITNTSGTLTKTTNTHAVLTENMVVNNLESDEATLPLSAAQGKALSEEVKTTYQKKNDNALSTTAKTVVGAINELKSSVDTNTGNITRIDRAVGNPVIEEVDLTQPTVTNKYFNANTGIISNSNSFNVKVIQLSRGDIVCIKTMSSPGISPIIIIDSEYNAVGERIIGEGKVNKTYSLVAKTDCLAALSYNVQYDYSAYIIKSPFNTAISDNSYMQYLHKVYEEYGAVYNAETGYWELNGLTDLTEEDMWDIYLWTSNLINQPNLDNALYGSPIRTTFTPPIKSIYKSAKGCSLNQACINCASLEVFNINRLSNNQLALSNESTVMHNAFNGCVKLRSIKTILYIIGSNRASLFAEAFSGCVVLSDVRIRGLRQSVSFKDSPLLSYESLNYLVTNAANTSAITVTVHPTTYSYLTGTAQPTEEVGGTTEEWQALVTTAQGKQISFAVPEETQSEVTE